MRTAVCVILALCAFAAVANAQSKGPAKGPAGAPTINGGCRAGGGSGFCRHPNGCGVGSLRHDNVCAGETVCCVDIPANKGGAACPKAKLAMQRTGDLQHALLTHCKKVQKQSAATCMQRVGSKIAKIRAAINARACARSGPKPAKTAGPARKALLEMADTPGLIQKLADYFVQKAAGTTAEEAAAGCNFQTKMNCRAYITDCADACIGEPMSGCANCMDTYDAQHKAGTFAQCCQCDTVRQFGIPSCSY